MRRKAKRRKQTKSKMRQKKLLIFGLSKSLPFTAVRQILHWRRFESLLWLWESLATKKVSRPGRDWVVLLLSGLWWNFVDITNSCLALVVTFSISLCKSGPSANCRKRRRSIVKWVQIFLGLFSFARSGLALWQRKMKRVSKTDWPYTNYTSGNIDDGFIRPERVMIRHFRSFNVNSFLIE